MVYLSAKLITYNRTNLSFGLKGDRQIMELEEIAKYAFMIFAIVAIVAGLAVGYLAYDARAEIPGEWAASSVADIHGYLMLVMLILGIIVGLVSITAKEVAPFLIASIALIVTGITANVWAPLQNVEALEILYYLGTTILWYFAAFAAPAAVIISMKSIWALAKEK